jgi:hypothetical protein
MQQTHTVQPVPVMDMEGHFIHPGDYDQILRGSTVEVTMSMSRYLGAGGGNIQAKIESMRILSVATPYRWSIEARRTAGNSIDNQ